MSNQERIALFIDGANLYATAKSLGFDIDYKRLLKEFQGKGRLIRAFYYTALVEDQEYSSIRPLIDWLEQLRSASVVCAVISNDDVAGIEHFLASHHLEPYFQAIWSAEHRPRKPDPAAVHGLCDQLGVSAADCALIGDANSDLRMAVAAGIPHRLALGYTAAWSTPPPLAESHPRVHHWRELSLA